MLKILAFKTSHVACFLVFGMLNAKKLAFSTLGASALILQIIFIFIIHVIFAKIE